MAGRFDNLYSRLVAWLKVLLPLAALGIVAAVFLLSRSIDPEAALTGAGLDVRDLAREVRVGSPDYRGMTDDGTEVRITADRARPDPDRPGRIEAEVVDAVLTDAAGDRTHIRGAAGDLDREADRLVLTGDASVETGDGMRVESAELVSVLSRTEVRSDVPVRASGPLGEITGDTMLLTRDPAPGAGHVVVFNGDVKLVYRPSNRGPDKP